MWQYSIHCGIPSEEEANTQNKTIETFSDRAPGHELRLMNSLEAPQGPRALLAHLQLGTAKTEETLEPLPAVWQGSSEDTEVSLGLTFLIF